MAKNNINYLKRAKKIQDITERSFEKYGKDIKYSAVWRNIIYPVYYISYASYIKIINETNLNNRIAEKENRTSQQTKKSRREEQPQKQFFEIFDFCLNKTSRQK